MNGRPKVRAWATLAFAGSGAVAVFENSGNLSGSPKSWNKARAKK